jgi:hypothetical protein
MQTTTASTDQNAINFDSVASLRKTIDNMQLAENVRAGDRALIDTLANGERPYTPEEVEKFQIKYNINWGELKTLVSAANRQINGALLFKPQLFTATSKGGQVEKRDEYSQKFTNNLNERLMRGQNGKTHTYLLLSRNASVCLHGAGAFYFPNDYCVLPKFAPLENLLIPTDTSLDFGNLSYFDIRVELSICELNDMISGDKVDEHWNVDEINKIISGLKDFNGLNTNNYNWRENPEKWQEIFKQNKAFLNSDAVAKVKLDYFFSKEGVDNKWYLKVFQREPVGESDPDKFLYQSDQPFAGDIGHILQVQYGDTSLVAPLKFHSVRGLGASLYSPAWALNMFRSGLFQHGEEQLRMYLRVSGTADKGRENVVNLQQYGILEDGVSFVPESERHQVDASLIESIMSQCRQNLAENSASFVADINDGTKKEMTLGEAQIRQQTVNIAVSSMLRMMYCLETFYYEEIVRRYLLKVGDKEAESFQKQCIADGIPEELLVSENWRIAPDQVLGAGDQSLALQEAGALFQNRMSFDPKSQRIIDRMFVSTVTRDPAKGLLIVPDAKDDSTSGAQAAEDVFGTLMQGSPVSLRQGITQNDYIEAMLKMASAVIQRITQTDNMGTMQEVVGLDTVLQDVQKHIAILEADPKQAQNVKLYGDAVGKLGNLVKAFGQRLAEASKAGQPTKVSESLNYKDAPEDVRRQIEAQAGLKPSQLPVTDPKLIKAKQGMEIKDAQFKQKQMHADMAFQLEQIRLNSAHDANLTREEQSHRQKIVHDSTVKALELQAQIERARIESEKPVDNSN